MGEATPIRWTPLQALDRDLACTDAAVGGVELVVSRVGESEPFEWRYFVEVDAMVDAEQPATDEADAKRKAHAAALQWARALVAKLEAVSP